MADRSLRAVAVFEATKGLLVLAAATGLLALIHRDAQAAAATLIEHLHLNPASRYPRIFLDAAAHLQDTRLLLLAAGAGLYAMVRLVEAYGLWTDRAWAEILAAASGAIYMPFEAWELWRHATVHGAVLAIANAAIVALMWRALRRRRHAAMAA